MSALDGPNLSDSRGRMYAINIWLGNSELLSGERNEVTDEIKNQIFENLKVAHIDESYFEFLNSLAIELNEV